MSISEDEIDEPKPRRPSVHEKRAKLKASRIRIRLASPSRKHFDDVVSRYMCIYIIFVQAEPTSRMTREFLAPGMNESPAITCRNQTEFRDPPDFLAGGLSSRRYSYSQPHSQRLSRSSWIRRFPIPSRRRIAESIMLFFPLVLCIFKFMDDADLIPVFGKCTRFRPVIVSSNLLQYVYRSCICCYNHSLIIISGSVLRFSRFFWVSRW